MVYQGKYAFFAAFTAFEDFFHPGLTPSSRYIDSCETRRTWVITDPDPWAPPVGLMGMVGSHSEIWVRPSFPQEGKNMRTENN